MGRPVANGGDELAQLVVPGVSVGNQQHPWPVGVGHADVIGGFAEVDHSLPADDRAARLGITVEAATVGDGRQAAVLEPQVDDRHSAIEDMASRLHGGSRGDVRDRPASIDGGVAQEDGVDKRVSADALVEPGVATGAQVVGKVDHQVVVQRAAQRGGLLADQARTGTQGTGVADSNDQVALIGEAEQPAGVKRRVSASGDSLNRCLPAANAAAPIGACVSGWVVTMTASTSARATVASQSSECSTPKRAASAARVSGLRPAIATRSMSERAAMRSARATAMPPLPTMATRRGTVADSGMRRPVALPHVSAHTIRRPRHRLVAAPILDGRPITREPAQGVP